MIVPTCPLCGGDMANRKGPHGPFWGCRNYPGCRGTRRVEDLPGDDDRVLSINEQNAMSGEEEIEL